MDLMFYVVIKLLDTNSNLFNLKIKIYRGTMKKSIFFENAKLLSDKLAIIPLMYGSLGLEYITDQSLNADDIDILIKKTD